MKPKLLLGLGAALLLLAAAADYAQWRWWRHAQQRAVDSAVIRGALALEQGRGAEEGARAVIARRGFAGASVEHPPMDGPERGNRLAVRVRLPLERRSWLLGSLAGPRTVTATATAMVLPTAEGPTRVARVE